MNAIVSLWDKVVAWWTGSAVPVLERDEQEVLAILQPLFGQVETALLQDLIVFVQGVLAAAPATKTLPEWETVLLDLAEVAGGSLLSTIKGLGSSVFQALIGLVLAKLQAAQAAKVASAAVPAAPAS